MHFLIADDDCSNRLLLKTILENKGETVFEAQDGQEAIDVFLENKTTIDVIILDVVMPIMDGLSAAKQIRDDAQGAHIPIIFMTGMVNENFLKECFTIGSDVLLKPISCVLASEKFNFIKKNILLSRELQKKTDEIEHHHAIMKEENYLAMDIFSHFMKMNNITSGNIRYHTSPTSTFNGDIFLAARSPMDTLYVFVGDLTGHGLSAAIASIPINKIFFTMTTKGISISTIAKEINQTLFQLLPDNIFCCGFLLEMSVDGRQVKLWSGGMPPIIITDSQGLLTEVINSNHMPLGSQSPEEFENNVQTLQLQQNGRMYLFTDGLTELQDKNGDMLGETGVRKVFSQKNEDGYSALIEQVEKFNAIEQHDDITLVEIKAQPLAWATSSHDELIKQKAEKIKHALPWEITMRISGRDFHRGDPASQLIQFLNSAAGIDMHQDTLSTILTELYSNALEHGLLKLDSKLKCSEDGFVDYYLQRSEGLNKLHDLKDYINIRVKFDHGNSDDGKTNPAITLSITDSGDGFNFEKEKPADDFLTGDALSSGLLSSNWDLHGRGHKLVNSLCHELVYSNGGRTATATYQLLGQ